MKTPKDSLRPHACITAKSAITITDADESLHLRWDFVAPDHLLNAVVAGAAGSVGLMLRVGHRSDSSLLLVLFAIWVLSPFMALVLANMVSKRWSVLTRATLHSVIMVLTLGSLAIYVEVVLRPPKSTPAFAFLVVPLGSWLLMSISCPDSRVNITQAVTS